MHVFLPHVCVCVCVCVVFTFLGRCASLLGLVGFDMDIAGGIRLIWSERGFEGVCVNGSAYKAGQGAPI